MKTYKTNQIYKSNHHKITDVEFTTGNGTDVLTYNVDGKFVQMSGEFWQKKINGQYHLIENYEFEDGEVITVDMVLE